MLLSPGPMHIPNGFLNTGVTLVTWVLTILALVYALRRTSQDLDERQVPLVGVLAAAIFAGQMLNFAVAGGTSGHLMGAAIAAILLGPWPAMIAMTCVVAIQALVFQDGGLVVLGANILNMGILGVLVAYAVYRISQKLVGGKPWGIFVSGFLAAWVSIVVAALAVALQLAFSGRSPANIAIPTMAGVHALIGIGEGLITVGALAFIRATRPDLIQAGSQPSRQSNLVWVLGLLLAAILAVASPLASAHPDGLEWAAEQLGFLETAQSAGYAIIPDYVMPGINNEALATILAGILGVLIVFGVALGVAYLRRKRSA
ncbi:MAG: energy-coupling factor ABC transporter permease [Anaerolineales bacterium]|nr:energy-coupling factor ABC transporter permease [Anaerolineales bacterium]